MPVAPKRWQVGTTLVVLGLATASSLLGLFRPGHYAGPQALLARTRVEDAVVLAVGVPALAVGLWTARRGSLRGRIGWLGALGFHAYVWTSRSVSLAFNDFFLGYVALLTLSLFTLVAGVLETDADAVGRRLDGQLSSRLYAGVLAAVAAGLALLWLSEVVPATLTGTTPGIVAEFGPRGLGTYVVDLGLVVPSLVVAAGWLWRGQPRGYLVGGALLVFGALLAPVLTAITVVDLRTGVRMTAGLIAGTVLPPLVAAAFAATYLRALGSDG